MPAPEPAPPSENMLLERDGLKPALLDGGTYALPRRYVGGEEVIILTPGDVRGTRFVHDLVTDPCPCCASGRYPCVACGVCGARVAYRIDDYQDPQSTVFRSDRVSWEHCGEDPAETPDPFALGAAWDKGSPRPELVGTHWRVRGLKAELYRDDPPA